MRKIIVLFMLAAMTGCKDVTPDANDAELEAAAEAGRQMGTEAASLPDGTMDKQRAILEIRAKETAIRDAGYPSCADTFAIEAAKKLGYY